jgi:hypothetical protein
MTVAKQLKQAHLDKEEARWDDVIARVKKLLNCSDQEEAAQIRELTECLLTMPSHARYRVLGCEDPRLNGFQVPYHPIEILEFVPYFVSYYILDDGEPGVGYHYYDLYESHVLCEPEHPQAEPYFHQNIERLRKKYPDAKWLTLQLALEIVKQVTENYLLQEAKNRECFPEDYEDEDEDGAEQQNMIRLVAELKKENDDDFLQTRPSVAPSEGS